MVIKVLKSKIHRVRITQCDLEYEGSIEIDPVLMDAAGIFQYEAVWIWNCNEGSRLMTYVMRAKESNTGRICLNGAAARLGMIGDLIIISAFADIDESEAKYHQPKIVLVDKENRIK